MASFRRILGGGLTLNPLIPSGGGSGTIASIVSHPVLQSQTVNSQNSNLTENDLIKMLIDMSQQRFDQSTPVFNALAGRSAAFLGVPPHSDPNAMAINKINQNLPFLGGIRGGDNRFQIPDLNVGQPGAGIPAFPQKQFGGQPGGLDVTQSPMFGALKAASESQFGRARENILSSMPQGGQLLDALSGLELDKARFMTGAIGNLAEDELERAFRIAGMGDSGFAGTSAAGSLLSQMSMTEAQRFAAEQARKGARDQALGSGLGALLGAGLSFFCWVAEELYGKRDIRTLSIRRYVAAHINDDSMLGAFCRLYQKHGKRWARLVKRSKIARFVARIIWDRLYNASQKETIYVS